jgi:hypothetical protein
MSDPDLDELERQYKLGNITRDSYGPMTPEALTSLLYSVLPLIQRLRDAAWVIHRNDCPQCSQAVGVLGLCGEGRALFAASSFSTPFPPPRDTDLKGQ